MRMNLYDDLYGMVDANDVAGVQAWLARHYPQKGWAGLKVRWRQAFFRLVEPVQLPHPAGVTFWSHVVPLGWYNDPMAGVIDAALLACKRQRDLDILRLLVNTPGFGNLSTHLSVEDLLLVTLSKQDRARMDVVLSVCKDQGSACVWRWACAGGDEDLARYLLKTGRPDDPQQALCMAASSGHAGVVSLLIPFTDPAKDNSAALRCATDGNHEACMLLLAPYSDAHAVIEAMQAEKDNGLLDMPLGTSEMVSLSGRRLEGFERLKEHVELVDALEDLPAHEPEVTAAPPRRMRL